jgi:hypothetical protein
MKVYPNIEKWFVLEDREGSAALLKRKFVYDILFAPYFLMLLWPHVL